MNNEPQEARQIIEAFSMQPGTWYVGYKMGDGRIVDKIVQGVTHDTGDPFDCWIGLDKDGQRLFQFRKNSVNVIF